MSEPYALVESEEGASSFRSYLGNPGRITVFAFVAPEPTVAISIPDGGASREGHRIEMDVQTARELSRTLSRELTAFRKRLAAYDALEGSGK